ncbi:hypothetical protein J2S60_001052 [Gleimia europaea]|nr:hypothetical protein [Gleimia europaea]
MLSDSSSVFALLGNTGKSKRMRRSDKATLVQNGIWERHRFENRPTAALVTNATFIDI